jgi:hypothetical protein
MLGSDDFIARVDAATDQVIRSIRGKGKRKLYLKNYGGRKIKKPVGTGSAEK